MSRITLRSLTIALAVLALLCLPSVASADGVTWNFSGVTFSDGGTITGSFVYDATTNTVSDINVTTTLGTAFGGATYLATDPGFGPRPVEIVLVPDPTLSDFTGTLALNLDFLTGLTNAGGAVLLGGAEDTCADPGCTHAGSDIRDIIAGEVVSSPEPASLLLLGLGLLGVARAPKRNLLRA